MKKLFSQKWIFFTLGCMSVLIMLILKSWLTLLGLILLLYTHPSIAEETKKNPQAKHSQVISFIILLVLPCLSLLFFNAANKREEQRIRDAELAAYMEEYRKLTAFVWDIDTDPSLTDQEKEFVKKAANNAIRNETQCMQLRMGGKSTTYDDTYYVQCIDTDDNSFNLYFTEEEVAANTPIKIQKPYKEAFQPCWTAISTNSKFPDTVFFKAMVTNNTLTNGDTIIVQNFTAQNAFGMEVPHQARCVVSKTGELKKFKID